MSSKLVFLLALVSLAHGYPRIQHRPFMPDDYLEVVNDRSDLPKDPPVKTPPATTEELQALADLYNDLFTSKGLAEHLNLTKPQLRDLVLKECSAGIDLRTQDMARGVHKILYKNYLRLIDDDNWKPSADVPKSSGPIDCDKKLSPQDALDVYVNPDRCPCFTNYRQAFTYRSLIHNSMNMNCCLFFADPMEDPTLDLTARVEKTLSKKFKSLRRYIDEITGLAGELVEMVPTAGDEILWLIERKINVALGMTEEEAEMLFRPRNHPDPSVEYDMIRAYLDHERSEIGATWAGRPDIVEYDDEGNPIH